MLCVVIGAKICCSLHADTVFPYLFGMEKLVESPCTLIMRTITT